MGPPNEVGPRDITPEGTDNIITSTPAPTKKQEAASNLSGASRRSVSSQQVSWWPVHTFVAEILDQVESWPMAGTPEWCALDRTDPAKWAALLDDAQHFALRRETLQEAHCEASRAVSGALDWSALAREIRQRADFYAARPWLRREVA
jgi:hypothetical protein